tara:strand:+ start:592 stop:750 length:159 start_codon:yes stop_codon:yes gene_type:complete
VNAYTISLVVVVKTGGVMPYRQSILVGVLLIVPIGTGKTGHSLPVLIVDTKI